jgi:hypothetical protein
MRNAAKPENIHNNFKAYFYKGSREFYISSNSYGYASWPDRYSQAAVDLDKYLTQGKDLNTDTNERIYFASFANSQEEFVSYLNLFFDLKFTVEPQTHKDRA